MAVSYNRELDLRVIYFEKVKAYFCKMALPGAWRLNVYSSSVRFSNRKVSMSFIPPLRVDLDNGAVKTKHFKSVLSLIEYIEIIMEENSASN